MEEVLLRLLEGRLCRAGRARKKRDGATPFFLGKGSRRDPEARAIVSLLSGNPRRARRIIQSEIDRSGEPSRQHQLYLILGECLRQQAEFVAGREDLETAVNYSTLGLSEVSASTDPVLGLLASISLGRSFLQLGDPEAAVENFRSGVACVDLLGSSPMAVRHRLRLARALRLSERPREALFEALEALSLIRAAGEMPHLKGLCLLAVARSLVALGQLAQAREWYARCLALEVPELKRAAMDTEELLETAGALRQRQWGEALRIIYSHKAAGAASSEDRQFYSWVLRLCESRVGRRALERIRESHLYGSRRAHHETEEP